MAHSLYSAISWQPPAENAVEKLKSKAAQDQVDSLTEDLRKAFSSMKVLEKKLKKSESERERLDNESKLLAEVCQKYEADLAKTKADLDQHQSDVASKTKVLEDRCKSLSALAEQHRLASSKKDSKIKEHEGTILSLHEKLEKELCNQKSQQSIPCHLKTKACNVLKTSTEILGLAAESTHKAKPDEVKMWLSEVCCAIDSLTAELSQEAAK